jgi:hypothetical protein
VIFADSPVLKNPGIPKYEELVVRDYLNKDIGFVTAHIKIQLKNSKAGKYYAIEVKEGNEYKNLIKLNYSNLSTIIEERYNVRKNKLIEKYYRPSKNKVYFYNRDKSIDNVFDQNDLNIYSRYAYFMSLRGFPFEKEDEVRFKSYMNEYGNALTMRTIYKGKEKIKVPAGVFECYKLEMSVAGWQSNFAKDKYYLYFTVAKPHYFVKFDQKADTGQWLSNELISYKTGN